MKTVCCMTVNATFEKCNHPPNKHHTFLISAYLSHRSHDSTLHIRQTHVSDNLDGIEHCKHCDLAP
eukprot:764859-Hanusia_phi.AAC.3